MSEISQNAIKKSKNIKDSITRVPHPQFISGVQYVYSLIPKKGKKFVFSNKRLLVLKGSEYIGYARELPDQTSLPFLDEERIPTLKAKFPISSIQSVDNEKVNLIIIFNEVEDGANVKWEFDCGTATMAKQWKSKIQIAQQQSKIKPVQGLVIQNINPNLNNQPNGVPSTTPVVVSPTNVYGPIPPPNQPNQIQPSTQQLNPSKQNEFISNNQSPNSVIGNNNLQLKQPYQNSLLGQRIVQNRTQQALINQNNNAFSGNPTVIKKVQPPVSSFFIGSNQVSSERQFTEMTAQMLVSQSKMQKARQDYKRLKQQASQIKESALNVSNILGSTLRTVLSSKVKLQKLNKNWNYLFLTSPGSEHQIIHQFRQNAETFVKTLVDELGLRVRQYNPSQHTSGQFLYQFQHIQIILICPQIEQISFFQDRAQVVSVRKQKVYRHMVKNYDHILQSLRNKGGFRVPLTAFLQYLGFAAYVHSTIPEGQNYENIDQLRKQIQILQQQSRINCSLFQDQSSGRITPLQSKIYQKIARDEGLTNKINFDLCFAEDLIHYLPMDFNDLQEGNRLRRQLMMDQEYQDKLFYGNNMMSVINRMNLSPQIKAGIEDLKSAASSIPQRIISLVAKLQNIDQIFTNSTELEDLMHDYGINIRYLGVLLQKTRQTWLKTMITAQIAARSVKKLFSFAMTNFILNLSAESVQDCQNKIKQQTATFLTHLFGFGNDTDAIWRRIRRQAQYQYRIAIQRQGINIGYFVQSVQNQLCVSINPSPQLRQIFKSNLNLPIDSIGNFKLRCKCYDCSFTQLYTQVNNCLRNPTNRSFQQLKLLLNLHRRTPISAHFKHDRTYDKIVNFTSKWLKPEQLPQIYQGYSSANAPSKTFYNVKMDEIRWMLKNNQQQSSIPIRDQIIQHVTQWLGPHHPILTDLYQMYAKYYGQLKNQQKKAINCCKSGIKNLQKLLGQQHIKLADAYYLFGQLSLIYGLKLEALKSFAKARQILKENDSRQTQAYGQVCLKMAKLYLAGGSTSQALQNALQAVQTLNTIAPKNIQLDSLELVCRCYETTEDWQKYATFCEKQLNPRLLEYTTDKKLMEKALKLNLMPILHAVAANSSNVASRIKSILKELNQSAVASKSIAQKYLALKIQTKIFPNQFITAILDVDIILDEIDKNSLLSHWKGFETVTKINQSNSPTKSNTALRAQASQFLASLQALDIFLSRGFISGVLSQK